MSASTPSLKNPRQALEELQHAARPPSILMEKLTPVVPESVWRARLALSGISVQYVKPEIKRRKPKVKANGG